MKTWIRVQDALPEVDKPVLAVVEDGKRRLVLRACWIARYTVDAGNYEGDPDYSEELDEYFYPEGWYEWNEYDGFNWSIGGTVTHWMPLPELPAK